MLSEESFASLLKDWVAAFMHHSMRNFHHYARENGLSMSQVYALFHIHRKGECGVGDVGDDLGVSNAAASQMLDRLVQQELILRTEDPLDRRAKQLVLTEKGVQAVQDGIHARQGWLDDLANSLSPEEQAQVAAALHILIEKTRYLENSAQAVK
jgi:DNA-binding MarR family transcriptional regulator